MMLKNARGQAILESILLVMIAVAVMLVATRSLKNMGYAKSLIQNPWQVLAGMVESGVWKPAAEARAYHPNVKGRNLSFEGDVKAGP